MKQGSRFVLLILFVFASAASAFGQAGVTIENDPLVLSVGESEQLEAVYVNEEGEEVDTSFTWKVRPGFLGGIDDDDVFTASAPGEGMLVATVGIYSDTVTVTVEALEEYPALVLYPEELELEIDEMMDVVALYYNESGELVDTTFTWLLEPDSLGTLDENLLFTALAVGEGTLTATLGELSSSIPVTIEADNDPPYETNLFVVPGDTIVTVGSEISFVLYRHTEEGGAEEMEAVWSIEGEPIGTITEAGVLSVTSAGFSLVRATSDSGDATALIIADNLDGGDPNTITITRESPNPRGYNVMATLTEGQAWTIGGLPHPLHILNGGVVYFPNGSLSEDIRIHIALPGFSHSDTDTVEFGHHIITGVEFQVLVDDEHVQPYWFDSPLFVSLIFKRGLVNQMGIDPADLALYFATEEDDSLAFDPTGVTNTLVDSVRNRIFANVAHFSALVVAPRETSTSVGENNSTQPLEFTLAEPWPNPFNAATSLQITVPNSGRLEVSCFDILGRHVATIARGVHHAGDHTFTFDGSNLSSGVYFLKVSYNRQVLTRKIVLLK